MIIFPVTEFIFPVMFSIFPGKYLDNTNESQTRTSKWPDTILAILFLASIFAGFFLYRKYYSEKPYRETK